ALSCSAPSATCCSCSTSSPCGSRCSRGWSCSRRCASARYACCVCAIASISMADPPATAGRQGGALAAVVAGVRRQFDPAVAWAFGCVVLVLVVGSLYSRSFLSPEYLLQQLKVASF